MQFVTYKKLIHRNYQLYGICALCGILYAYSFSFFVKTINTGTLHNKNWSEIKIQRLKFGQRHEIFYQYMYIFVDTNPLHCLSTGHGWSN